MRVTLNVDGTLIVEKNVKSAEYTNTMFDLDSDDVAIEFKGGKEEVVHGATIVGAKEGETEV